MCFPIMRFQKYRVGCNSLNDRKPVSLSHLIQFIENKHDYRLQVRSNSDFQFHFFLYYPIYKFTHQFKKQVLQFLLFLFSHTRALRVHTHSGVEI